MKPLVIALSVLAHTANASCPQAGDITTGIQLTFADGPSEVYRQTSTGDVVVDGLDQGALTHRLELLHGLYLGRYVAMEEGQEIASSAVIYGYPEGESGPLPPVVEGTWAGDVRVTEAGETRVEPQDHRAALPVEVQVGGCTLLTIPVTITYGDAAEYIEIVHYFPELGLGYLFAYQNSGNDMNEQILTTIEALE